MTQNPERPAGCRNCGTKWLFPLLLAIPLLFGLFNRPQQNRVAENNTSPLTSENTTLAQPPAESAPPAEPAPVVQTTPPAEPPVTQAAEPPVTQATPPAEPAPPVAEPPAPEPAPPAAQPAPVAAEPVCSALSISTTTPGATIEILDGAMRIGVHHYPSTCLSYDILKV